MQTQRKSGGIAAFYMAAAYIVAMPYFIFIFQVPEGAGAAERLVAVTQAWQWQYLMELVVYVVFGLALIVLASSLHERLGGATNPLMKIATPIAYIWSGLLIASGMIYNVGMGKAIALNATDHAAAAALWEAVDCISSGLSGNGEIVGGSWMLLVSLVALRSRRFSTALNVIGLSVAIVGIAAVIPPLKDLAYVFGIGQIVWFIILGFSLLKKDPMENKS